MRNTKLLSLFVAVMFAASMWAAEMEGPWTYVGMKSGTCDQSMNNSISYNNLNNSHWGTVTFWNYDNNGIGFVVQGSSVNNSKNAVYSLYSLTKTIPSYSRCQITWQYQVKGQNVKHYSRTSLYEHTNLSTLQAMAVDFTLDQTDGSGSSSRLYSFSNKSFAGIQTSATQTRSYDFDNRTGTGNSNVARYLLMTHVSTANEMMNDLDEWGSFKSVSATETWTYRVIFTFKGNGNTGGSMSNQTIDNSGNLTDNAFTRTGYTFSKWTANQDGSGSVLGNKASVTASSSYKGPKTLYAQWTANKYTVTFDRQDGTGGSSSVQATYDANMPSATMPTRTGYTFQGYYDATSGGTKYYNADGSSACAWNKTAAATLYARWSVNQYTITFDCNGGSAIDAITQNYGTAVTAPADPTREGYTFAGWDPALPETMPAENMTVVAQWDEIPAPDPEPGDDGKLPGAFTINANGDKVQFSKGNLQATTADNGSTWTWAFATNQYDFIGDAVANNAINGNKSVSANGTVDLFGWSTAATYYGIHNSNNNADYAGDFVDWGNTMTGEWRTLSRAEFRYIVFDRAQAYYKQGKATVNSVKGYIFLPDKWTLPSGLSFTPSPGDYTTNQYDGADWDAMENAGAVFLPAAGQRKGTSFYLPTYGWYWTSTSNEDDKAYYLYFYESSRDFVQYDRYTAQSVRLVTNYVAPAPVSVKLYHNFSGDWAETDTFEIIEQSTGDYAKISMILEPGDYEFAVKVGGELRGDGTALSRDDQECFLEEGYTANLTLNVDVKGTYRFYWFYDENKFGMDVPNVCGMYWKNVTDGQFEVTLGQESEVTLPKVWAGNMAFVSNIASGVDQVRLVSTDETVATIEYTLSMAGLGTITLHKAGECDIYAVHDITDYYCYDSVAFHLTVLPEPAPEPTPTVWTSLSVGDVIKVGDQLNPSEEWESANDYGVIKPDWAPYTLVRANIVQEHEYDDPEVTEAEDGAYYVFRFTHPTAGTVYLLSTAGKGELLAATATSDGLEVTNVGDDYGTPAFTFAVHDNGGTPTAVENVQTNEVQASKLMENGVLYIMYNGIMYNVQGSRVR